MVLKPQLWFESKATAGEEAEHTLFVCEHSEDAVNAALGPPVRCYS